MMKMKPKKEVDLNVLKRLITIIDGYRINRCTELGRIEKDIQADKVGSKIAQEWKDIRRLLYKVASVPRTIPKAVKLTKMRITIRFLTFAYFAVAFILIMPILFFNSPFIELPPGVYGIISMIAVVSVIAERFSDHFLNWKIAVEIDNYYKSHPEKFRFLRLQLKKIVQDLINTLSKHVKDRNEDPKKHAFILYNIDYEGITITRNPGRLTKYYTAIPAQVSRKAKP
jgi:hypothetical protein